ncbi:MAG: ATP-binding protein [Bacteroidota bacterium]|nr:ATP-binding protein [Bacteroidota bacterium]
MKLSIKLKIIIAYTLLFGTVLVGFAFIIYQNIKESELERIDTNLTSYSTILQSELEEQVSDEKAVNMDELKSIRSEGLQDVRLSLFDKDGNKILFDSLTGDVRTWKEVIKGKNIFETLKTKGGHKYRSFFSSVEVNGDTLFVLQAASSMREMNRALERLRFVFFLVIPLALLLAGLAAYLISRAAFRPVKKMAQTARNITANSLNKRLELPKAKDEIYFLGATLNDMINRLDNYFKSQKQFIADASHEIRTPLTILQSELELLERELKDDLNKESIRTALSEIETLSKLTSSLLTLAKLDSTQLTIEAEQVCIDELLIESAHFMKKAAEEKNISFEFNINEPVQLQVDKDKLKSVFINLIDNAIKYSFRDSVIRLEINRGPGNVSITVQNFGIVICPSELTMIFDRFFRSNEVQSKTKGNGLGLTIAKEFIEMHNGSISAESDEELGTRFIVQLPL